MGEGIASRGPCETIEISTTCRVGAANRELALKPPVGTSYLHAMRHLVVCLALSACASAPPLPPEPPSDCGTERAELERKLQRAEQRIAELEADKNDDPPPVIAVAPAAVPERVREGSYRVPRAFLDDLLSDQSRLMRSVRVVPAQKDGVITGVRLFGIRPESPLSTLGFSNGDELRKINGQEVSSPDEALKAYTQVRGASVIDVELVRNSEPITLHYQIVD